jgi:hypothetical protein
MEQAMNLDSQDRSRGEQMILDALLAEGAQPGEHVNLHRVRKHIDFSVIEGAELIAAIQRMFALGLLEPGHHEGWICLTQAGYDTL